MTQTAVRHASNRPVVANFRPCPSMAPLDERPHCGQQEQPPSYGREKHCLERRLCQFQRVQRWKERAG